MRVLLDGVSLDSSSGPNSFARKLTSALCERGNEVGVHVQEPDARLLFIQGGDHTAPTALRLDGIYFNTRQDWRAMNEPIRRSYDRADLIIHQTEFDKRLIEGFFGAHPRSTVIRNGADTRKTMSIPPLQHPALDSFAQTWVCAASWRPHKRLIENIRYFHECAGPQDCLVVAGDVSGVLSDLEELVMDQLDRVMFVGNLGQDELTSLYRRSSHLIHLAWLDHCPNVVVDARAAGCRIVCSSSGGTEEVAGLDAVVVVEVEWDLTPLDLYRPPRLDFSRNRAGRFDIQVDMTGVAESYEHALKGIMR